jgi:GxxExxY protein
MSHSVLTGRIVDAAVEVQRQLGGTGLLESVYEESLAIELELRGIRVRRQVAVPVHYKGQSLSVPLRLDLLVEEQVVVECKAVEKLHPVFARQTLTYLRLTNRQLALLINFGERPLRRGVHRIVNGLPD